MNTSWENPSGHRAISYEENLSFILSVFFWENLSFFVWKIFRADSAFFFVILPCSTIPLFTFFLFCTGFFCCSEEVVTELLSEY